MQEFITNNFQWIFSGIGATGIGLYFTMKNKSKDNSIPIENNITNTTINIQKNEDEKFTQDKVIPTQSISDLKKITNIIIIDDDTKFQIVNIFKNAGWRNTKIVTDIADIDSAEIANTHVFFVDIQGVGKKLGYHDEGLGLANALMTRYPNKKIIIYSAQSEGDRFNATIKRAFSSLPKNADPYEFQQILEAAAKESFNA